MKKGRITAHRVGIAPMVLCIVGLTAWTLLGCSSPASPASTSSWTLSFDGNGSDGGEVPATKKYAAGTTVVLPDAGTLTKTGLLFTGWNTKADGSGMKYRAGEAYYRTETSPVTLYAQWEKGYAVSYDGNGSDGGTVPATKKYAAGATVVLPDAGTLTKTGLLFKGWNTKADGSGMKYRAGEAYRTRTSPDTFYAQWEKGYAVSYDGNGSDGGEVPATKKYLEGAKVILPGAGTLTKTDLLFKSWNTEADGSGRDYPAGAPYTMGNSPDTFYAQWEKGYAVSYDGNGSDGGEVPATKKYLEGAKVMLPFAGASGLTKTGFILKSWNTKADGSGMEYPPGGSWTMRTSSITFYAQWGGYPEGHDMSLKFPDSGTRVKKGFVDYRDWNTETSGRKTKINQEAGM